ncbi:hypothetical protein [Rhodococcus pyridinivorans]|uniref:hypothetical protein n=1 Tax=Rhodococcus pyridinivorans TaxID=103816 RepID=UPI003AAD34E9
MAANDIDWLPRSFACRRRPARSARRGEHERRIEGVGETLAFDAIVPRDVTFEVLSLTGLLIEVVLVLRVVVADIPVKLSFLVGRYSPTDSLMAATRVTSPSSLKQQPTLSDGVAPQDVR